MHQMLMHHASPVKRRFPTVLVTNLNRQGLDHDEIESLMHESGHILHHVLSQTDYAPHSGGNVMVKGAWVEFFSQINRS